MPGTKDLSISRSHELRTLNRHRVLRALRALGPCSRAELGRATALSAAAISSYAAELVSDGVVRTARAAGVRGRPQSQLVLRPDAAAAITLSLTIDRLEACLIDHAGVVHATVRRDTCTRTLSEGALIDEVLDIVRTLTPHPAARRLRQVSIGFQGIVAQRGGTLVWSPILSVNEVPLGQAIESTCSLSVSVHNDCRLIAGALHAENAERLGSNFATVLFTHGVGLALILGDRPFEGVVNSALEMGHLVHVPNGARCRCGRRGCIEAYAADYAILNGIRQARGETLPDSPGRIADEKLDDELRAAAAGDVPAGQAFERAGTAIGAGLAQVFLLTGAMPVALVGRSAAALDVMRPSLLEALRTASTPQHPARDVPVETFSDDRALLQRGLALDALIALDRQLAQPGSTAPVRSCAS